MAQFDEPTSAIKPSRVRALSCLALLVSMWMLGCSPSDDGEGQGAAAGVSATSMSHSGAHDDEHADMEHGSDGEACNGELRKQGGRQTCWMTSGGTTNGADSEQEYFVSVSDAGYGPISADDQAKAESFRAEVVAFLETITSHVDAEAQGWSWGGIGIKLAYYNLDAADNFLKDVKADLFLDHIENDACAQDQKLLVPDCPEMLMYLTDGVDARLVGAMFIAPPGVEGPQFAGRASVWHFHVNENLCYDEFGLVESIQPVLPNDPNTRLPCQQGETLERSPQMLHVWLPDTGRPALTGDMTIDGLEVPDDGEPAPYISTVYSEIWNVVPSELDPDVFEVLDPATNTPPSAPS